MNSTQNVPKSAGARIARAAATICIMVVAPIVSLIALPIIAISSIPKLVQYQYLYNKTFTNQTREKFGRIPGQDYTRWNGQAIQREARQISETERLHELVGQYASGYDDTIPSSIEQPNNPFSTQEDLNWLNHEYRRREVKEYLDLNFRALRIFAKALIPIIGVRWVVATEARIGRASQATCLTCETAGKLTHWNWQEAICFHTDLLKKQLNMC